MKSLYNDKKFEAWRLLCPYILYWQERGVNVIIRLRYIKYMDVIDYE